MYIKEIFKRFRVYITTLTMLTIGLLSYQGDIVLAKNPSKIDVNTAKREAVQRHSYIRLPKKGHETDSPSTHNSLNLQRIICNTTAESAPYNMVKIKVYKHNPDMPDGLELLAYWGPKQLSSGNNDAVSMITTFEHEVLVQVSYLAEDGTEYLIGQEWLSGWNNQELNFINEGNRSNYSMSYSISIDNSSI
ncbi:hypothetical protein RIVM261_017720 [Rivularia sp. IAM M-261]|nr:hypothetical protein CAL7716_029810 [Calothrix sp. PCC 7716]GJD16816.1 hypothetical protein RIVM261_017720 [Rivularia sp. IAM M-261]